MVRPRSFSAAFRRWGGLSGGTVVCGSVQVHVPCLRGTLAESHAGNTLAAGLGDHLDRRHLQVLTILCLGLPGTLTLPLMACSGGRARGSVAAAR
jgi:hypothetical protein